MIQRRRSYHLRTGQERQGCRLHRRPDLECLEKQWCKPGKPSIVARIFVTEDRPLSPRRNAATWSERHHKSSNRWQGSRNSIRKVQSRFGVEAFIPPSFLLKSHTIIIQNKNTSNTNQQILPSKKGNNHRSDDSGSCSLTSSILHFPSPSSPPASDSDQTTFPQGRVYQETN
jgi:hypothetical protein